METRQGYTVSKTLSQKLEKKVLDFYPQMITKTQKALKERLRMTYTEVYVH